ncbi:hypothetical protein FIBSPDRAFT_954367 [Athelia psychrophila]|uniref:Uncharacterized protein n=1 Tax=Athelia psychrophila TaxID=1759441 RepID=A0A166JAS8_9AGAM|nr:hypothetical protein FIBSPDRAFT_954367 [Fibularhizoctonia sp. CBS 109695]
MSILLQAPFSLSNPPLIFSADSLLKIIDSDLPDVGVSRSRQTVIGVLLNNINNLLDRVQRGYAQAHLRYMHLMASDPPAIEEIRKARAICSTQREILAEASMAAQYFHYMLADLERARESMDMLSIEVPNFAARLDDCLCPTEEMIREASTRRTYHSRIPAILRGLPEVSPTHDHISLPDLANILSNLTLGESLGPRHYSGSRDVLVL